MTNALLDKARAILAHPKKAAVIEPAVPASTPGGNAPPHTAPVTKSIEIQPAAPNAQAVYWETGTGRILGPALPEFLMRDGSTFWISTTFDGQLWWINADLLRSRQQWAEQKPMVEVDRHLLKAM